MLYDLIGAARPITENPARTGLPHRFSHLCGMHRVGVQWGRFASRLLPAFRSRKPFSFADERLIKAFHDTERAAFGMHEHSVSAYIAGEEAAARARYSGT